MPSQLRVSLLAFLSIISLIAQATAVTVPLSSTFKYVNEGEFGDYIVEYGANYRVLDPFNSPFQLCFYNTTPNAFTLALRMGTVRSTSTMRWVWEANRGNPVGENATLTFGEDGNLVLADADGRIAWQTNTANKGVVHFQVQPNGNMVLQDVKGYFIWQSFDYPTDTLLVGQSLRAGGAARLVSRRSDKQNSNGAYSLVMEPKRLAIYYKPSSPKPKLYYTSDRFSVKNGRLQYVTFQSEPVTEEGFSYDLALEFSTGGNAILATPKYNSTLSFLRLGVDGNVKVYTYNDKVDIGAWEITFTLFPGGKP
ncbi:hypothetical protein Peur_037806 [Populus x canadensis]|uniref:Bulb-type lectin domain-containing protein n=1 Tax=Populus deltoides TaxID=3696 RepID=A0A8T2ZM73_POPDE|nr:hypothetical protein H0E87_000517 [Populus deltoides]